MASDQIRTYDRANSVVFLKTDAPFGGLSNMAGGFPLYVQGARIYTSEALYQACRYPRLPEVQRLIIDQTSPMTAKMKSKPHRKDSRADWDRVRVKVMRWCLRVKLAQNWDKFSELLLRTGDLQIVEESRRDDFWGAKPVGEQTLVGMNVLGRLLMQLRGAVKTQGNGAFCRVEPLDIPEFLLFGQVIGAVVASDLPAQDAAAAPVAGLADRRSLQERAEQASLFDALSARETLVSAAVSRVEKVPLADIRAYPAMKDSGVPWVGKVPAHWDLQPIGRIGALLKGRGGSKEDEASAGIPCVRYGDLYTYHEFFITSSKGFVSADRASGYTPIKYGDVLFAGSGETVEDIGRSAVNLLKGNAVCGGDVILLRPNRTVNPRFLGYAADAPSSRHQKARMGRGFTVVHIYGSELKHLTVAIPPVDEQLAIVRFLDYADRRIRRYIRAKQKLIKLLEEQKQAILHDAVTRGLDPNVRRRHSGVGWLGDVPNHWTPYRLKALLRAVDVRSTTGTETLLSLRKEYGIVPYADHFSRPFQARSLVGFKIVESDQLVVNRLQANNGLIFRSPLRGLVSPDYSVFVCRRDLDLTYLQDLLRSQPYRAHFRRESTGLGTGTAGFLRLYDDRFLETPVFLPPLSEQESILDFTRQHLKTTHATIEKERQSLILVNEYRNRLISDVVTGKVDVRDAALEFPESVEIVEPRDEADVKQDVEEAEEEVEVAAEEAEV